MLFEINNIAEERQIEEYTQQESGRGVGRLPDSLRQRKEEVKK